MELLELLGLPWALPAQEALRVLGE